MVPRSREWVKIPSRNFKCAQSAITSLSSLSAVLMGMFFVGPVPLSIWSGRRRKSLKLRFKSKLTKKGKKSKNKSRR